MKQQLPAVQLPAVTAISDMVAPVVLITVGVLMVNGLLSTYTALIDQIRRERLDPRTELATMARLIYGAMLIVFGGIALFIGSVVWIALAEAYNSETFGAVAVWLIVAGLVAMLASLVVMAIAYRTRRGS